MGKSVSQFLSSVFLSMGATEAIFEFSRNNPYFILILIDCNRGTAYWFGAKLTNLGGIKSTQITDCCA